MKKGKFILLLLLGCCGMMMGKGKRDSLLAVLASCPEDTNKVNVLYDLGWEYMQEGDLEKGMEYADASLMLAKKIKFIAGVAFAHSLKGSVYRNKGDFAEALKENFESLRLRKALGERGDLAIAFSNIGTVYKQLGNYPEAQKYTLLALAGFERKGDRRKAAGMLNNIGEIYRMQKNPVEALSFFLRSKKIKEELADRRGLANSYNNLGAVYWELGNHKEALAHFEKAKELYKEEGKQLGFAIALGNIGSVHEELGAMARRNGNPEQAAQYSSAALTSYNDALAIAEHAGDKVMISDISCRIGTHYLGLKNFSKASFFLDRALRLATGTNSMENRKTACSALYELCEAQGDSRSAYGYYRMYIACRDSLQNEENTKKTIQAQMQYDFDKKAAADSVKNAEAMKLEEVKHQQEIARQKTFTWGGIIGFVLMIGVALISFNAYRNKKKANTEIAHQKALAEEKQKEILDSIHYARRIQRALITSEKYVHRHLHRLNGKQQ